MKAHTTPPSSVACIASPDDSLCPLPPLSVTPSSTFVPCAVYLYMEYVLSPSSGAVRQSSTPMKASPRLSSSTYWLKPNHELLASCDITSPPRASSLSPSGLTICRRMDGGEPSPSMKTKVTPSALVFTSVS